MGFEVFDDYECEGQLSIDDILEVNIPEGLIGVSKIFARAKKQMSLAEYKTFIMSLTEMKFKENNSVYAYIDKKVLAEALGIHSDINHLSQDIFNNIKELPKHSFIEISDRDLGIFDSGCFITRITSLKNQFRIKYDDEYIKLFSNLGDGEYITMWSGDILRMSNSRSIDFYEYLRLHTDTREKVNRGIIGIKQLKEMFDIPKEGKGSYMREKGGFDRANFEKYVINPLFEDLKNCKMITPVELEGKWYNKLKKNGRVIGYEFYWTYSAYPAVATASEVKQIQERVDKNPQVLKVAKDIIEGEKKPKKKNNKNNFNNFSERKYTKEQMLELEKKLLNL